MISAFISATPVGNATATPSQSVDKCSTRRTVMKTATEEIIDKNYPPYRRNRAPTITVNSDNITISMEPIQAYCIADKNAPPLLDYSSPGDFVPDKPTSPSAISWPSGDGRGDKDFEGVASDFDQPNLKTYGPFPDFYKRSCEL